MFNRTAPRALALAFATVIVVILAVVAIFAIPVASAPAATAGVVPCSAYGDGMPVVPGNGTIGGVCYLPTEYHGFPTLDTADYGTDIPRCASDDFNADHVARCYTERVTDGAVLVLDQADTVIATLK